MPLNSEHSGFTLLEVMVAIAIIAIALTAVLGSQSQSLSLASESKFTTTAVFLAQHKMAETEAEKLEDLASDSGYFEDDFSDYFWDLSVSDVALDQPENVSDHLKQIDLTVYREERDQYKYSLRLYRFVAETK